ncbi:hypothetical protein NQT69_11560 [Pseudoalteromonas shioyasakiensis]|uniref:hypothetical protein n=1 Tax=Pseudoalteromonas shioyasakiensis TaxID=1190813 RepID=UPI0021177933|nr:hypothetical protein [Pseudoalteromonas shioyasakiensis]MCQ8878639.1 hypothetical protein [Pseudoalteromonas shioyasakiensis]
MNSRIFKLVTPVLFIVFFVVFKVAVFTQQQVTLQQQVVQIEKRIALDLPRLDLSNIFLKHSGNSAAITSYIERLNEEIPSSIVRVNTIGDISISNGVTPHIEVIKKQLLTSDSNVSVIFFIEHRFWQLRDVFAALLCTLIAGAFGFWAVTIERSKLGIISARKEAEQKALPEPLKLVVDLNTKTLANNHTPTATVALANKPLCFYLALIEFCIENPDVLLNQNKNVPEELIEIANKYFYRLIELGHTIRKRPNFTNSLEKTLSEIRAALDEVLIDYPESKDIYYPPKAHGEGSRSRLHSYGLNQINCNDIEVIGK